MPEPKLTVELVPATCWYSNVRSQVPPKEWDRLRKLVYIKANYCCEVCGGKGAKWPVEAHELWHYDDTTHLQQLVKLVALCPNCHAVKHFGRTALCGQQDRALKHLAHVNSWTIPEAKQYVAEQFKVWEERSTHDWDLDLTYLQGL